MGLAVGDFLLLLKMDCDTFHCFQSRMDIDFTLYLLYATVESAFFLVEALEVVIVGFAFSLVKIVKGNWKAIAHPRNLALALVQFCL